MGIRHCQRTQSQDLQPQYRKFNLDGCRRETERTTERLSQSSQMTYLEEGPSSTGLWLDYGVIMLTVIREREYGKIL